MASWVSLPAGVSRRRASKVACGARGRQRVGGGTEGHSYLAETLGGGAHVDRDAPAVDGHGRIGAPDGERGGGLDLDVGLELEGRRGPRSLRPGGREAGPDEPVGVGLLPGHVGVREGGGVRAVGAGLDAVDDLVGVVGADAGQAGQAEGEQTQRHPAERAADAGVAGRDHDRHRGQGVTRAVDHDPRHGGIHGPSAVVLGVGDRHGRREEHGHHDRDPLPSPAT